MCFNKWACRICSSRWLIVSVCLLLGACAAKQTPTAAQPDPQELKLIEQASLDKQLFESALKIVSQPDVSEQDLQTAFEQFQQLYQANPAYLGALVNAADIAYRLKKTEQAVSLYQQVLAQSAEPRVDQNTASKLQFKVHSLTQLGLLAREAGQFDAAEDYYRQALSLAPQHPVVLRNFAILLDLYRGKLPEALQLYEQYQALQDEPETQVNDWIFDLKTRLPEETP
jgi:tetratricopeptide (TPR) repeat protein